MSGAEGLMYLYLAGTALQMAGTQQEKREKRQILNQSLAESDKTQKQAIDTVQAEAQQMSPAQRAQAMSQNEQATYNRSVADVGAGGAMIPTAGGGGGAVSADFARLSADRAAAEGQRLSSIARELAKVRAPGDTAANEAMRRGSIAEQLGSLWSTQRARSKAASLDAESVEAPAWGQLGGLVATGAGAAIGAPPVGSMYEGASSNPSAGNYVNEMDRSSDAAAPWWSGGAKGQSANNGQWWMGRSAGGRR